ncbi:MAG: energy-coupling factor transporter transmembrane component T [Actinomycetota bacterium]|nr:energy-coupling factor transporter transmembrane component T [Actinomycetota bacterium]
MELYLIDSLASSGKSPFHRASAPSKIFFAASVVFAVIILNELAQLVSLLLLLIFLISALKLPTIKLLFMTSYMAIFAAIFALSQINVSFVQPLVIISKAVAAALGLLILFATTNYFDIFGAMAKFMPKLVADALFMTYRSFFILLKELNDLMTSLKIRGGLTPKRLLFNLKNLGSILGTLLIHAIDMSSRSSSILNIRGYHGGITHHGLKKKPSAYDLFPLLLGAGLFLGAITLR